MTDKVDKSEAEWREQLTPNQYAIAREGGTERAFTGIYWDHKAEGVYRCICCDTPLFASDSKYDSGSGWPSFTEAVDQGAVATREDNKFGMRRTEILCAACNAHLGHVFPDGPGPTGLRFCVNSASLRFEGEGEK